jgi:hypothetical protein
MERVLPPEPVAPAPLPAASAHSWQLWAVDQSRFVLKRRCGKGSYGDVVEATDAASGARVAVKRVANLFSSSYENGLRIFRELRLLRHLRHPNIVRLRDAWVADPRSFDELFLIFELYDTDMSRVIRDATQPLSVAHVRFFMCEARAGRRDEALAARPRRAAPARPHARRPLASPNARRPSAAGDRLHALARRAAPRPEAGQHFAE